MTKQQQDLVWACLPKEAREEIRKQYKIVSKNPRLDRYDSVYLTALENLFGHHNLTSDSEPEEMLMISKQEFQKKYEACVIAANECDSSECAIIADLLEDIFGDKCLPDTTIPSNSTELNSDKEETCMCVHACGTACKHYDSSIVPNGCTLTTCKFETEFPTEQLSVQDKPKFKVGDKVRIKSYAKDFHQGYENGYAWLPIRDKYVGKVYRIKEIWESTNDYILDLPELIAWTENDLEPYTEPETKENMKQTRKLKPIDEVVKVFLSTKEEETEFRALLNDNGYKWASERPLIEISYWRADDIMIYVVYPQKIVTYSDDGDNCIAFSDFKEKYLEPESRKLSQFIANCDKPEDNQLKDNMEEKELNLAELLKGCEEEEFYCPYLRNNVKFIGFDKHDGMTFILSLYKDGLGYENLMYIKKNDKIGKSFVLYPSRALYEKYPLDPVKAWSIWASERKPKYELKVYYQIAGNNNDDEVGQFNTIRFYSLEEAEQAAEAVKETLMKFHQKNQEK